MNLRDVLRLKPGDVISFSRNRHGPDDQLGEIVRVTPNGGVLFKEIGCWNTNAPMPEYAPKGALETWLPYQKVWRAFKKPRVKTPSAGKGRRATAQSKRPFDPTNPFDI